MLSTQISFLYALTRPRTPTKKPWLGTTNEESYENIDGKLATFRFRGLRDLNVTHDDLEHGAELSYREDIAVDESTIQKWVASKEELGVFRPITPSTGPHYASRDIIEKMYEPFPHLRPDNDPQSNG